MGSDRVNCLIESILSQRKRLVSGLEPNFDESYRLHGPEIAEFCILNAEFETKTA
jgi:hypothetical protein